MTLWLFWRNYMSFRIKQKLSSNTKFKQIFRIRAAAVLEMGEDGFASVLKRIEENPLFRELSGKFGAIRISRTAGSGFFSGFDSVIENLRADSSPPEVDSLIEVNKKAVLIIKKIGMERFEEYFLYNEKQTDRKTICSVCGISPADADLVEGFLNSIAVLGEFYFPSKLDAGGGGRSRKIAKIVKSGETLSVQYYLPQYARGRYIIDYEKIDRLRKDNEIAGSANSDINGLLREIETANTRKSAVCGIIDYIIVRQAAYLLSGSEDRMVSCTQKAAAAEIGLDESVLSRAIFGRSVEIPSGKEAALGSFFPSRKDIGIRIVRSIIDEKGISISDNDIARILREAHGMKVSRRTVNSYRNA